MEIRPTELPSLRNAALDVMRKAGAAYWGELAHENDEPAIATLNGPVMAAMQSADLYFVTKPMAELAIQAGKSLATDFRIAPEDVPSPTGLVCFEEPIHYDQKIDGGTIPITAALWFPLAGRLAIVWLADRYNERWMIVGRSGRKFTAHDLRRRGASRLMTAGFEAIIPDGVAHGFQLAGVPEPGDRSGEIYAHHATLKAAWLLMGQTLAAVESVKSGRPRIDKGGRTTKRPEIRVITLRRPAGSGGSGESDREWHHRWVVRGHWRMQPWGPARERRRPVWIAPHVKGPEGAPMLGGEKVYALRR